MNTNNFKGPKRKTYYDMNPWYEKNKDNNVNDWHQQIESLNKVFYEELSNYILKNKPAKIIEAACGGGNFTLSYANPECKIDAFEYSDVAISLAQKKNNPCSINFFQGDALDFSSYKNKPYDLLIAKDLLHCIIGDDRKIFINNIKNSIQKNGTIFLSTHINLPVTNEFIMKDIDPKTRINNLSTRVYLDREFIENEFISAGFKISKSIIFDEYYSAIYELEIYNNVI